MRCQAFNVKSNYFARFWNKINENSLEVIPLVPFSARTFFDGLNVRPVLNRALWGEQCNKTCCKFWDPKDDTPYFYHI